MEHDGCKLCKYEHVSGIGTHCQGCKQNQVDKYIRITNADRIRSMSDEEFAEFWLQHCDNPIMEFNEDICDLCDICESSVQCDDEYCKNSIVKWLQSKVEE